MKMEGTYDVMFAGEKMGEVSVSRQGLYWQFSCRCSLSGEVMYYLWVHVDGCDEKLGLLMPEDAGFCLKTKLAMKRFGQGRPVFTLRPKHELLTTQFVPVRPEEPFAYLHRLQEAHLASQKQQIGVVLPQEK